MASDTQLVNSFQTTAGNTPQIAFTSPTTTAGTLLTSVVISNDTLSDAQYTAYIGPITSTPTLPIVPRRTITTKRTDVPPELAGQVVLSGEALWFETTTAGSAAITVTGRNLNGI